MTNIKFFFHNALPIGFSFEGHAGTEYSSTNSLACAALSLLSNTTVNALETVAGVLPITNVDGKNARLDVTLPDHISEQQRRECEIILQVLIQGAKDINDTYPGTISIDNA